MAICINNKIAPINHVKQHAKVYDPPPLINLTTDVVKYETTLTQAQRKLPPLRRGDS